MHDLSRRRLIFGASALGASGLLGGCELITGGPSRGGLYGLSDTLTFTTQRFLLRDQPLAREFGPEAISTIFPTINTTDPDTPDYRAWKAQGFAGWRLPVTGLVAQPEAFSLADLKAMPARTQITLHSCEQGWSAIGAWTGVRLSHVLAHVGLKPEARFLVIRCIDGWWDSYDLFDALHPQTILAFGMNGRDLPVAHGAPLRLRVERQLGYKSLKYLTGIEAVARVDTIGRGGGSMLADLGLPWYAGI